MSKITIASLTADKEALQEDVGTLRAKVDEQRALRTSMERERDEARKELEYAKDEMARLTTERDRLRGMLAMLERLGTIPPDPNPNQYERPF